MKMKIAVFFSPAIFSSRISSFSSHLCSFSCSPFAWHLMWIFFFVWLNKFNGKILQLLPSLHLCSLPCCAPTKPIVQSIICFEWIYRPRHAFEYTIANRIDDQLEMINAFDEHSSIRMSSRESISIILSLLLALASKTKSQFILRRIENRKMSESKSKFEPKSHVWLMRNSAVLPRPRKTTEFFVYVVFAIFFFIFILFSLTFIDCSRSVRLPRMRAIASHRPN